MMMEVDTKGTLEQSSKITSSGDAPEQENEPSYPDCDRLGCDSHVTEETSSLNEVDKESALVADQQHTLPLNSNSNPSTEPSSNSTNLETGENGNDNAPHKSTTDDADHPKRESISPTTNESQQEDTTDEPLDDSSRVTEQSKNDHSPPANGGTIDHEERTSEPSTSPELSNDGVYTSVVSPLVGSGAKSPLNMLSLDEEIAQAQQQQDGQPEHTTSNTEQHVTLPENTTTIDRNSSPIVEDRNLEQFSEILLETDTESEEEEIQSTEVQKKSSKRVRFADDLESKDIDGGLSGSRSPPPRPTLPSLESTGDSSKHPGVPVSPSLKSPEQTIAIAHHTTDELIAGVEYPAEYLGSTPIILAGVGAIKSARMHQAQQAVQLIKDPENDSRPHFSVKVKISTQAVKIADSNSDVDMMEHPLHSIAYVADIDGVLVIMAHVRPYLEPSSPQDTEQNQSIETTGFTPKMTCHVLDAADARHVAMVIGQAFGAAYKEFLMSVGISEESLEEAEYTHILNAQTVPQVEVDSLSDRSKSKKITMAKHKGEAMGIMVMESGYGSAIPACVIAHMNKTGSAAKSGLLNVGDHIISLNGVSLVGMPRKLCNEQIKKCRQLNVVKMVICSCPPVVDVTMMRPDLKYQLGFTVQEGMICSLTRGSIAERSGIRVGHRIIEINGTSTVNMQHSDIVHLLSSTVGDLHIRTMPDLLYKLFTGKILPEYY